jgi:predicted permease
VDNLLSDLRYALRLFAKRPLTTLAVLSSLSLGIGLNTAIFTFLNALFLHPLPGISDPSSLITIYSRQNGAGYYFPVSFPNYLDVRRQPVGFSQLGAYQLIRVGLAGKGEAEQVTGEIVSANFFRLLGVRITLGRDFSPDEDAVSKVSPVVVLSQALWQRSFASSPNVLGHKLLLNGSPFVVIGIASGGFRGTNSMSAADLWVPLSTYRTVLYSSESFEQRSSQSLQLLGRLQRGQTFASVDAGMKIVAKRLERDYPTDNHGQTFALLPMTQAAVPPDQRPIYLRACTFLIAIAGAMLLLACVNIANLILVKTLGRGAEFAVRMSVGADRRRIVQQLIVENIILSLLAGALALLIGRWGRDLLWRFRPPAFTADPPRLLDWRILAFTFIVSMFVGLLFSIAPALSAAGIDLTSSLKQGKRILVGGRVITAGDFLIFVQATLSSACLACAGFCMLSLYNTSHIDPGFSARRLLAVSFDLQFRGYAEPQGRAFYNALLLRLKPLSGIEAMTLAENRLLGGFRLWRGVLLPGHGASDERIQVGSTIVDSDYFTAIGLPIVRGRGFTDRDRQNTAPVVVVNEAMARRFWPDHDAIGDHFQLDDETNPVEVVGITRNSKYQQLGEVPQPFLYLPLLQRYSSRATLHIRTSADPSAAAQNIKQVIQALDPSLPLIVRTLPELLDQSLWIPRLTVALLTVFSVLALLLAGVGVYGVTSQAVSRRRFEIGIRMALGAQRIKVVNLLVIRGMAALGLGVFGGLLAALLLRPWISSIVFHGESEDSLVLLLIVVILTVLGLVASLIPTLRVTTESSLVSALRRSS